VLIAKIIKEKCKYELKDPVQFREKRGIFGIPSPFVVGLIKVQQSDAARVAELIKYFDITDTEGNIWHCRALPLDKDLAGTNIMNTNLRLCVFVKNIPKEYSHA